MNIKQMHIAFDQGVQYLASNRARGFFPEEKDLIINKMVTRYILSRLRPKGDGVFELDSMAQEQLKTLLSRTAPIPAEIAGTNYNVLLPSDLGWYIAGVVNLQACSNALEAPVTTLTKHQHTITFPKSDRSTAKYYIAATLSTANIATINTAQGGSWIGLSSKEQLFDVVPHLVQELRKTLPVYVNGNKLLVLGTNSTLLTATADGASVNSAYTVTTSQTYTPTALLNKAPIRIVSTVNLFDINSTAYYRSSWQSVVASLQNNSLTLEGLGSGIITSSEVIYVRKPRIVSLSLGSNSDIPEEYHDELIDMAIAYAKTELNAPDWEKKLADNKLNTTI